MDVRIVGVGLPGRDWATYANVHVGIQCGADVVDLFPGDVDEAVWDVDIDATAPDGDLRGPYVHGRRGDRFLYLGWGTVDPSGAFEMFRRAKLMLGAVDGSVAEAAARPGHRLVGRLGLTGGDGGPRCAAVRPPEISWTAAPAS